MRHLISSIRPCGLSPVMRPRVFAAAPTVLARGMAGGRPERSEFEQRTLELLKGYEKIDPAKLTMDAHFNKDLGLDSLDTVEVLMAIEDEFMIEIPDNDADNIHTVRQAIDFVYQRWTPQHFM